MQLSFNPKTPNFQALYVSPAGHQAIKRYDARHIKGETLRSIVSREQEKRANDMFVDCVLTGMPDEYGYYYPILAIKDKVTGETYRGIYKADSSEYFMEHDCKTKDGRLLKDNEVLVTDSNNKELVFSLENSDEASRFPFYVNTLNLEYTDIAKFKIAEKLEEHYRRDFEIDDKPKSDYDEFNLKYGLAYNKPLEEVVPGIMKENNLLGRGREKDVYKIPGMSDYVLCVIRDEYDKDKNLTPFVKYEQSNKLENKDEPILKNDNGIYIKKYTQGSSHSIPNWVDKCANPELVTYDDVECFKSQLADMSAFPVKSFVNFAKELQKMNGERIRIDTINPNNVIVDNDTQRISVIDIRSDINEVPEGVNRPINGLSDMEAVLLDSLMYKTYYDIANDEDKTKLDEYAKTIIKKCRIAAKVSRIGNLPENTANYADYIDEKIPRKQGKTRKELYEGFREHFKGDLSEEIVSSYVDPGMLLFTT